MRSFIATRWLSLAFALVGAGAASAATIQVAVASNFAEAAESLVQRFEERTGHRVVLSPGSTGKHYAQIRNGAPFDLFLAADSERPRRLEEQGLTVPDSRFTYAMGQLVLWSPLAGRVDAAGAVLDGASFRFLALANPKLAPYGRAAREVLEARGLWQSLQGRLVRGENVGQAFQFVHSGNAELGFVAKSQIWRAGEPVTGSWWQVPGSLYSPIEQQAVLLTENPVAREFVTFLRSEEAARVLASFGYGTSP